MLSLVIFYLAKEKGEGLQTFLFYPPHWNHYQHTENICNLDLGNLTIILKMKALVSIHKRGNFSKLTK